jgi:hypothetical protein
MKLRSILASALLSAALSCAAVAQTLGPVPPGGVNTVFPSLALGAAAAPSNTTLIQNALTSATSGGGGTVNIACPGGGTFYTNGHVTIGSNTDLEIPKGCTWRQAPGVGDNMIVSTDYVSAWTTLYDNSGVITNGPLSVIWSNSLPSWAATTAYAKGNYIIALSGNIYWESVASCTSTTGSGPTGTGSGITDGTCSWNYVTAAPFGQTTADATKLSAIIHWPAHGLTAGTAIWITPEPDSGLIWTGTSTAHQLGGPVDDNYMGNFPVAYVNDANYITVTLRSLPAAAFTGIPMNIMQASQNIKIGGGGLLNYDQANQSGPSYLGNFCSILAGIQNLKVSDIRFTNCGKWAVYGIGLAGFDIGGTFGDPTWTTSVTNGDNVDIYGPSWDGVVHDMNGNGYDDIVAIATQYHGAGASSYTLAAGDVRNVTARNISATDGYAISVYPVDANTILDGITLDTCTGNTTPSVSSALPTIRLSATSNPGTGAIGNLTVRNCEGRNGSAALISSAFTGNFSIENFFIENSRSSRNGITRAGILNLIAQSGNTQTINNLVVSNSDYRTPANSVTSADAMVMFNPVSGGTDVVNHTTMLNNYATSNGTNTGVMFEVPNTGIGTVTLGTVELDNNVASNLSGFVIAGVAGDYILHGNRTTTTPSGVVTYGVSTLHYSDNNFNGMSNGIIRFGAVVNDTVYSGGGNVLSGGSVWFTYPSAGTSTNYGWDISCDVTKATRTTGEYCLNNNAAPGSGTLTTAGLVADQGTTANSWFLLQSPTLQQY